MSCNEKKFIKERDMMLKRRSVEEFIKFVNANKQYYGEAYVKAVTEAPYKTLEVAINKMIVNVTSMPEELRSQCGRWLVSRGYSLDINL